jgi:hypothetical protein
MPHRRSFSPWFRIYTIMRVSHRCNNTGLRVPQVLYVSKILCDLCSASRALWADVSIDNLIAEHLWSFSCDFASTDMMVLASPAALTSSSPLSNVLSYSIKGPFEASHGFLDSPILYLTRDKSQDEDERTSTEVEPRPECQISGLVSICSYRARKTWNDTTALCRGILRQSAKSTDRGFIEKYREKKKKKCDRDSQSL